MVLHAKPFLRQLRANLRKVFRTQAFGRVRVIVRIHYLGQVYDCVPGAELGVDLWVDTPNPPGYTAP